MEARKLSDDDPEHAHVLADRALLEILKHHGYDLVIAAFHKVKKYYA